VLLPPGDIEAVRHVLSEDSDVAAVILEPTGAGFGMVPVDGKFLSALREATEQHNVVLIFDEVVTGFRVSPGGAQAHFDVRPDLTTLAKILAGGLPGAAVVGSREILDALDFDAAPASGREKIQHQGTYNANPVSAAAGTAALSIIETTDACQQANAYGERLRGRLNQLFAEKDVPWAAYGTFSGFHIFTNANSRNIDPETFDPTVIDWQELKKNPAGLTHKLRLAMLINGVDITDWPGGTISTVHTDTELEQTVDAFRESIRMLRAEDAI
jgi:glutamate-1-semialdehyde 2,1-aminomutase